MAEYGFNPNNDPTLPVAGAVGAYSNEEEDSGYRGWGNTSSNRKASTTLGSNSLAGAGMVAGAQSDGGQSYGGPSPGDSEGPLAAGYPDAATTGAVGAAALGAGAGAAAGGMGHHNRNSEVSAMSGVRRGPSNASSAYSGVGGAHSDASEDIPEMPSRPYYQEEVPYNIYNDVQTNGPYDGMGAQEGQPVIRDVQARRNTRIERAPTFPQQGGIAQNF